MRCVNQAAAPAAMTTTSATSTPTFVAAFDFFSPIPGPDAGDAGIC